MSYRFLASFAAVAGMLVLPAMGQTQSVSKTASAPKKSSTLPRTPDGHPDLQGIWTNVTLTPLERAQQFAGKPTLTDAEALAFEKTQVDNAAADRRGATPQADVNQAYNGLFYDRGSELARVDGVKRTSLIVDPPDGRVPMLPGGRGGRGGGGAAPAAARAAGAADEGTRGAGAAILGRFEKVQDRPLAERCLIGFSSTSGPPMLPVAYNNNYQIVQTPDHIMILVEMVHDVRIVRMNAQHAPSSIRLWLGDSVGHWDGDTLVVETTNFSPYIRFRGSSENLKVTERFKRVDAGTILYRVTIEDPTVFAKAWTAEYPFLATPGPLFEYACHEGNYAMPDILGGARLEEKAGEGSKK